jgi:hypothetical protein
MSEENVEIVRRAVAEFQAGMERAIPVPFSTRKPSLAITSGFSRGLSSMGGRSGAAARGSRSS